MPTLRQPLAGVVTDSRRKPDCIFSAKTVSRNADFFSVSSLTLSLEADTTDPFIYDISGNRYELQADVTLAVTDSAHNFIYIDHTGAMGREATPPAYAWDAPSSPATGQCWYDLGKSQMKRWDGSAWQNVSRVFIGYVRADSGAINARYACEPIGLPPLERYSLLGDGSDGFLDVSSGTTTIDGYKFYRAVVVRSTGDLRHTATATTLLAIYCQGVFLVLNSSGVNLAGLGRSGGAGGTGVGTAGGGAGEGGGGGSGGGGTSAGAAGGGRLPVSASVAQPAAGGSAGGGAGNNGGASVTSVGPGAGFWNYLLGNGGGGGGGNGASAGGDGGDGGGSLQLKASCVALASGASAVATGNNGTAGPAANRGGGGAGGGGSFVFFYRNLFNDGTIDVAGGTEAHRAARGPGREEMEGPGVPPCSGTENESHPLLQLDEPSRPPLGEGRRSAPA